VASTFADSRAWGEKVCREGLGCGKRIKPYKKKNLRLLPVRCDAEMGTRPGTKPGRIWRLHRINYFLGATPVVRTGRRFIAAALLPIPCEVLKTGIPPPKRKEDCGDSALGSQKGSLDNTWKPTVRKKMYIGGNFATLHEDPKKDAKPVWTPLGIERDERKTGGAGLNVEEKYGIAEDSKKILFGSEGPTTKSVLGKLGGPPRSFGTM